MNRAKIAIFKLYNSELPKISQVNKSKTTLTSSAEDQTKGQINQANYKIMISL